MSYILRNRFGSRPSSTSTTPVGGGVTPRRVSVDGVRRPQGTQVQQQILLQGRTTVTPESSQMQQPRFATAQQRQSMMNETLEDVRMLEELQREAQRRVASAEMVKQRHSDQLAALDSQLKSLKYSNGEKRALISRARDLLSSSHREITALQSSSDRNGNSIRRMEEKLRQGLEARRVALMLSRFDELRIASIAQKEQHVHHLQQKATEILEAKKKMCQDLEQRQKVLANARQEELAKTQKLAETIASTRTENLRLEQQLSYARQLEAAATLRNEGLAKELTTEEKRSSALCAELNNQIGDKESEMKQISAKESDLQTLIERKAQELQGLRARLFAFIEDKSEFPVSEEISASAVLEHLQRAVDKEQDTLNQQVAAKGLLEVSVENITIGTTKKEENILQVNEKCNAMSERLQVDNARQDERQRSAQSILAELTKAREEVDRLHSKVNELTKVKEQDRIDGENLINEQSILHQKKLDDLNRSLLDLETEKSSVENLRKSNRDTTDHEMSSLAQAHVRLQTAQELAEQLKIRDQFLPSEEAFEAEIQDAIREIKDARAFLLHDIEEDIALVKKKYPPLRDMEFSADPSKSTKELAKEVFADVIARCDKTLGRARKQRDESKLRRKKGAASTTKMAEQSGQQIDIHESEVRVESCSSRKVTFRDDTVSSETKTKIGKQKTGENLPEFGSSEKKGIIEIDLDPSPILKTDIRSVAYSNVNETQSEAKPRDLLPAFTQASQDENSLASAQEAKGVVLEPTGANKKLPSQEGIGSEEFATSLDKVNLEGSTNRRIYGTAKFGTGAILRRHRSSYSSGKSGGDGSAHQSKLSKGSAKDLDKDARNTSARDLDKDARNTSNAASTMMSSLKYSSQIRMHDEADKENQKSWASAVVQNSVTGTTSDRASVSGGERPQKSQRRPSEVTNEAVAKKRKAESWLQRVTKPPDKEPASQSSFVKREATRNVQQDDSTQRNPLITAVAAGTKKRGAEKEIDSSSKRSRKSEKEAATKGKSIQGSKLNASNEGSKGTQQNSSLSNKPNVKETQQKKESTQSSGISSMERALPKKPKKKASVRTVSRGLTQFDDIDDFNFLPKTKK